MIKLNQPFIPYDALDRVVDMISYGNLSPGYVSKDLEEAVAEMAYATQAVVCSSGTTALETVLSAYGIGPGDEVVTTPFTFRATVNAILRVGATPRFADIDDAWLMDIKSAASLINEKTKAIIPVHLYGAMVDVTRLRNSIPRGVLIIEDACQAHGSSLHGFSAGSLGDASVFSFYGSKNVAAGEGGAIVSNDSSLISEIRSLINHGSFDYKRPGTNLRMNELACAIALGQIHVLGETNLARQANAELILATGLVKNPQSEISGLSHNYHLFTVRCYSTIARSTLQYRYEQLGVQTGVYYSEYYVGTDPTPRIDQESKLVLSLPVHPMLTDEDLAMILEPLYS